MNSVRNTVMNPVTNPFMNTVMNTVVNTVTNIIMNFVTYPVMNNVMNSVTDHVTNPVMNLVTYPVMNTVTNTVTNSCHKFLSWILSRVLSWVLPWILSWLLSKILSWILWVDYGLVWSMLQLKFNSLELDSEVGRLVLSFCWFTVQDFVCFQGVKKLLGIPTAALRPALTDMSWGGRGRGPVSAEFPPFWQSLASGRSASVASSCEKHNHRCFSRKLTQSLSIPFMFWSGC